MTTPDPTVAGASEKLAKVLRWSPFEIETLGAYVRAIVAEAQREERITGYLERICSALETKAVADGRHVCRPHESGVPCVREPGHGAPCIYTLGRTGYSPEVPARVQGEEKGGNDGGTVTEHVAVVGSGARPVREVAEKTAATVSPTVGEVGPPSPLPDVLPSERENAAWALWVQVTRLLARLDAGEAINSVPVHTLRRELREACDKFKATSLGSPPAPPDPAPKAPRWRVGRSLGRTLYRDEHFVGVLDTPELAREVVEAMNGKAPKATEGEGPSGTTGLRLSPLQTYAASYDSTRGPSRHGKHHAAHENGVGAVFIQGYNYGRSSLSDENRGLQEELLEFLPMARSYLLSFATTEDLPGELARSSKLALISKRVEELRKATGR